MDVHKAFVVACIASTDQQGVTSYKSKRFSTYTGKLRRCAVWLAENNCKDVCMESTGNLFTTFWKLPAGLSSLTRSEVRQSDSRQENRQEGCYYDLKFKELNKYQHKRALALTSRKLVRLVFRLLKDNRLYIPPEG